MNESVKTRLYVEQDLGSGVEIALNPAHAHFLRSVLRLAEGDCVALFNGRDGEWRGRLTRIAKNAAYTVLQDQLRPQTGSPDIWLAFAPIKRSGLDFLVQKSTELGVSALLPVITRRTNVERVKEDRLTANAVEAAEQSQRLDAPRVSAPVKLDRFLNDWPRDRVLLVCAERGIATPITDYLANSSGESAAGILIGPEGGFDDSEFQRLKDQSFTRLISLGPRVLRAETAALAALSVWLSAKADWDERPAFKG